MSPGPAPIPFRIRVGVLGLPGAAEALTGQTRSARGERFLEILRDDVTALRDEASIAPLARTRFTEVALAVVSLRSDAVARELLDAVDLPASVRRRLAPPRAGETKSPAERLVDECDVLVVLSGDPLTLAEAEGAAEEPALDYARRRGRPVIAFSLRDGSERTVEREGIDLRSVARIEMYNLSHPPPDEAAEYAANETAVLFGPYPADDDRFGQPHPGAEVPRANRELVIERLVPHYVKASSLSKACQKAYLRTASLVYLMAVVAVALVAAGALLPEIAALAFGLELVVLIAILLLITTAHRRRLHAKWLESRFLTERIRHAMYLVACGVRPVNHRIPPHVGGRKSPDLWMLMVFEEICARLPELPRCDATTCTVLSEFVRRGWVGDQLRYHREKASGLGRWNARLERAGVWMFMGAILAAATHLVLLGAHALHLEWAEPAWLEGAVTWLALVLPAAGASIGGFRAHRELSRLSKRSAAMASALEDMELRLERVSNPEDLEAMLAQIEGWMVDEAQGWLMLMGPLKLEAV